MQRNKKFAKAQNVYVGIDVHLKSWDVTCLCDPYFKTSFNQPASAQALAAYLKKNFPGAEYYAAYESGFTGFSTYYALEELGIRTVIVNAADVPTTQKEAVMKNDRRDSIKLAESLKAGSLNPIYVHPRNGLDDRSLVRLRKKYVDEMAAYKVRLKHMLHCNGVSIPPQLNRWSAEYARWLRQDVQLLGETKKALLYMVDHVGVLHKEVLAISSAVTALIRSEKYAANVRRLMTIPGVGRLLSITLLTEIGDFSRFPNEKAFACALGLVPTCHNSGEKVTNGEKTFRGNTQIGKLIMECCWKMISKDPGMHGFFCQCAKRMNKNKAIVKVARRLSNIIFSMMKTGNDFDPSKTQK